VINGQHQKDRGHQREHQHPGGGEAAGPFVDFAGEHHELPLRHNHGDAVKGVPHPAEQRLFPFRQGQQIKAVRRHVVRGRGERQQPEKRQRQLQKMRRGNGQGHAGQRRPEAELHRPDPPAPRLQRVHDRAPERLDDPGQIQPARVKCNGGVRQPEVFIKHHRHRQRQRVRQPFRDIKRRHPGPRGNFSGGRHCCSGNFTARAR
jgi:hypothetical protein